jgi:hypothetical protein
MRRALPACGGLGAALAVAVLVAAPAGGNPRLPAAAAATVRRHRVHRPAPPLPHALTVDEQEWSVTPSQTVVGAGTVRIEAHNRGQDVHDLVVAGPHGIVRQVGLLPGAQATIAANLPPGSYHLYCSLYEGTPQSHDARGMHAWLTVR